MLNPLLEVELVDYTRNPEIMIGMAAAECYDAKKDDESCRRRAIKCKDSGHLATMRFAYATIRVNGLSRICSHQLVRMAHAGILQRSQRYVNESGIQYIDPPSLQAMPYGLRERWMHIQEETRRCYDVAIECGMKKEDARYILLHSATTSLHLCLNFQGWQDFLRNRMDKAAQWEIREVAELINRKLNSVAPNLFQLPKN